MRGRSRSRSRSRLQSGSIQDRLGVRKPQRNNMRMRRQLNGNELHTQRSRSRVRLNRSNFRNTNNGSATKRSSSVNARLGQNGPPNQVQNQRRRFRSRSRNVNGNKQVNRPLAGRIAKRKPIRKGNNIQQQILRKTAIRNVAQNIRNTRNSGIRNNRINRASQNFKRWIRKYHNE
jgi:hypothetical protein